MYIYIYIYIYTYIYTHIYQGEVAELLALDDDRAHGFVGMASEIPRAVLRKVDILKFLKSQLATELTIENHSRDGFEEIFGNPPRYCARKTFSKVSTMSFSIVSGVAS